MRLVYYPLLLLYALQLRTAPLHGLEKFGEVVLEVGEDLVSVVLCAEPYLALAATGVLHDLRAPLLGPLKNLFLRGYLLGLILGAADDTVALAAGLVEHRLALLDDPARLLELLRDSLAHLVNDVEGGVPVDHRRVAETGEAAGVLDQFFQPVYEYQYVHLLLPILRLRSLYLTVPTGIYLLYALQHAFGYEPAHLPAERSYLPYHARGEEAVLRRGHYEDGFELGKHPSVELRLLELRFEVRDGPEALHDHLRAPFPGEIHEEPFHHFDGDGVHVGGHLLQEPRPVDCGKAGLLAAVSANGDDHVVEDLGGALDDVEVPRRYRVETTWTHSHDHCQLGPIKYGYERAAVTARYPFLASCALNRSLAALDRDPSSRREQ